MNPWEMTREEYRNYLKVMWEEIDNNDIFVNSDFYQYSENVPHKYFNESIREFSRTTDQMHYRAMKHAIYEQRIISKHVLAEYPMLVKEAVKWNK